MKIKPGGGRIISRIQIEDLNGLYTYDLQSGADPADDLGRLFILYGDNGSGKTTILKLAFNLLSRADRRGHRTFVASVAFRRFSIELTDRTVITAVRDGDDIVGTYRILVKRGRNTLFSGQVKADSDARVRKEQDDIDNYVALLHELNIELYFLGDDRKGQSSLGDVEDAEEYVLMRLREEFARSGRRLRPTDIQLGGEQILRLAVKRFNEWAQEQAFEASSAGEANTNNVYAEIVKHIAKARHSDSTALPETDNLQDTLQQLDTRSQRYASLGLVSPLQLTPIIATLRKSSPEVKELIGRVIKPYVQGIDARLNALERLQGQLSTFVHSLNSFFSNKEIEFRLPAGLVIRSQNGNVLEPEMLSSGERQLLLLFCNTAVARDRSSIFLIDEPEISLNVKWQRKLLRALLDITADSPVQFLIATHSMELLSQFRNNVRRLDNLKADAFHD